MNSARTTQQDRKTGGGVINAKASLGLGGHLVQPGQYMTTLKAQLTTWFTMTTPTQAKIIGGGATSAKDLRLLGTRMALDHVLLVVHIILPAVGITASHGITQVSMARKTGSGAGNATDSHTLGMHHGEHARLGVPTTILEVETIPSLSTTALQVVRVVGAGVSSARGLLLTPIIPVLLGVTITRVEAETTASRQMTLVSQVKTTGNFAISATDLRILASAWDPVPLEAIMTIRTAAIIPFSKTPETQMARTTGLGAGNVSY